MYRRVQGSTLIQRLKDGAFIPADPDNRDYQQFLRSGEELLDPEPAPQIPDPIDAQALLETLADLLSVPVDQVVALARQKASRR